MTESLLTGPRATLRAAPTSWDGEFDYGLLLAMHFDGADLPLARRMLQAVARYDVPPGVSPELVRAGLLVAGHGAVEDVWSHWAVLERGFDGYRPLLAAAGLAATRAFAAASDHPARGRVLAELAELTEPQVTDWVAHQRARFPADPAGESLLNWSTHARELGEPGLARRFLLEWAQGRDRTTLSTLRVRLGRLGLLPEAIEAQRERVALAAGARDRADELVALASLHREAGDAIRAHEILEEAAGLVPAEERGAAFAGRLTRELREG